jgi:hypothetical protein
MTRTWPRRSAIRSNRRLAVALVLLGLFMQGLAPYLPMPGMGGAKSGAVFAWLPRCLVPQSGAADAGSTSGGLHRGDCAACLVMQQAGSALPPPLATLPLPAAVLRAAPPPWQQAQRSAPSREGFSSRAPPRPA